MADGQPITANMVVGRRIAGWAPHPDRESQWMMILDDGSAIHYEGGYGKPKLLILPEARQTLRLWRQDLLDRGDAVSQAMEALPPEPTGDSDVGEMIEEADTVPVEDDEDADPVEDDEV